MTREYPRRQRKQASGQTGKLLTWSSVSFLIGYLLAHIYDVNKVGRIAEEQFFPRKTSSQPLVTAKPQVPPKPKFEFYTLLSKDDKARAERSHRYRPEDLGTTEPSRVQTSSVEKNNSLVSERHIYQAQPSDQKSISALSSEDRIAPAIEAKPTQTVVAAKPVALPASEPFKERLGEPQPVLPKPNLPEEKPTVPAKSSPVETVKKSVFAREAYTVQVAAFNRMADAQKMKNTLSLRGYRALIAPLVQGSVTWYRVQIGPFPNVASAENARMQLERYAHMRGMIRKMDA